MVNIKACFHSGAHADEIRRFTIESRSASYDRLVSKIRDVFPAVEDKELRLQWQDGDDCVTFSSDEELAIAVGVVKEGVLFVFVRFAGEEHHFDCPYLDKLHHCTYLMQCLCGEGPHEGTGHGPHACPYLEKYQGSGCPNLERGHPWGQGMGHGYAHHGFGSQGVCPLGFGSRGSGIHGGCPLGFGSQGFGHHGFGHHGFGDHGFGHHGFGNHEFGHHGHGMGTGMGGHGCCDTKGKGKCPAKYGKPAAEKGESS